MSPRSRRDMKTRSNKIHRIMPSYESGIGLPWWLRQVKNLPAMWKTWVQPLGREDPLEKEMATYPVFLPGEPHGQRSLEGYSPWGCRVGHSWVTNTHTHEHGLFQTAKTKIHPRQSMCLNTAAAWLQPGAMGGALQGWGVDLVHALPPTRDGNQGTLVSLCTCQANRQPFWAAVRLGETRPQHPLAPSACSRQWGQQTCGQGDDHHHSTLPDLGTSFQASFQGLLSFKFCDSLRISPQTVRPYPGWRIMPHEGLFKPAP